MKITINLIDGSNMEFEGKYGEVGVYIEDGFYKIKLDAEERLIQINTRFILCVDIKKQ